MLFSFSWAFSAKNVQYVSMEWPLSLKCVTSSYQLCCHGGQALIAIIGALF